MQTLLASIAIASIVLVIALAGFVNGAYALRSPYDPIGYSQTTMTVLPQETEYDFCNSNKVELADLLVRDASGNIITQTTVGSQVMLETTVVNNCDNRDNEPLLVIFEVRDPDGITGYLAWYNSTINSNERVVAGSSWVAPNESGEYTVRAHYIACLNCPMVIHPVLQYKLTVMSTAG